MTQITCSTQSQAFFSPAPAAEAKPLFVRMVQAVWTWKTRSKSRLALAKLDNRMLEDIGLNPADVDREISKPFWLA